MFDIIRAKEKSIIHYQHIRADQSQDGLRLSLSGS